MNSENDARIPVTLLTGFLGSGKTTLLNAMLRAPEMAGCAVLINEVGAIGIDHLLVEQVTEDVVLLESGCLCCTVRGEFSRSLRDLFMRRLRGEVKDLRRVVIETTGLADPAPVAHMLMRDFFLAERFRLDGIVTTVDARNVAWQLGQHEEAVRQVAMADRVVLTKCDLLDEEELADGEARVRRLNPLASQWRSRPGAMPEGLLTGMALYDPASVSAVRHDERVETHVLRFTEPFTWPVFSDALDFILSLAGERILRIKGLVAIAGEPGPRVVHGVRQERYPSFSLPAWPDEDRDTRLVFIVRDVPLEALELGFKLRTEAASETTGE
ncbi:MAG: GTP-binding protein [Candidatus Dactylopiibacterium carminicum]|nr:MAG: GTP-binding protein [Candidatus Dactylopiibacterium carminicum]